jgi:hypothetical protein
VEYGSPAPFIAIILAIVSGTLLAVESYVGGAITGVLAVIIFALWQFGRERGDDDSHTIW